MAHLIETAVARNIAHEAERKLSAGKVNGKTVKVRQLQGKAGWHGQGKQGEADPINFSNFDL